MAPQHPLTASEIELLHKTTVAGKNLSYAPYSKFRVGAAVLLADGAMVSGGNVENAAYPAGNCAERSAILTAKMTGHDLAIRAVGVTSDSDMICSPCGVCRQFIREFAIVETPIYMWTVNGDLTVKSVGELLPLSFGPDNLK